MWKSKQNGAADTLGKALEARLDALERKVEGTDRAIKALELEWNSTLDKLNRIIGRLNARKKYLEPVVDDQPELPQQPQGFNRLEAERELARRKGSAWHTTAG